MLYVAIVVLSICSCFVGFRLEIAESNVRHMENGREPNAGASLLPTIPVIQLCYLLATWALNQAGQNGYLFISLYSFISMTMRLWRYRMVAAQFKALLATHHAKPTNQ